MLLVVSGLSRACSLGGGRHIRRGILRAFGELSQPIQRDRISSLFGAGGNDRRFPRLRDKMGGSFRTPSVGGAYGGPTALRPGLPLMLRISSCAAGPLARTVPDALRIDPPGRAADRRRATLMLCNSLGHKGLARHDFCAELATGLRLW